MSKILLSLFLFSAAVNLVAQMKIDTLDIENYKIQKLEISDKLKEISSLEYLNGYFWGNNDSGGKPELYKIDSKTGQIVQTVEIANTENIDWEEISFGDSYVFIADTGNNQGSRKDLKIYYFPLNELDSESNIIKIEPREIEFIFEEQKNFNPGNKMTNFDCEAFFFYNGKLHLFTKEWSNLETTHYTLEIKPGKQFAKKIETFKTNYLVTGATIDDNPISNTYGFYLIGYTLDGISFISGFSLPKQKTDILFSDKTTKFNLPLGYVPQLGQTEGIAVKTDNPSVLCFSNEEFKQKKMGFYVKQSIQCIQSLVD